MTKTPKKTTGKIYGVNQITHTEDKRKNIPTAEYQVVVEDDTKKVIPEKTNLRLG